MHIPPPVIAVAFIALMFVVGWLFPGLNIAFEGQKLIAGVLLLAGIGMIGLAGLPFLRAKTTVLPNRIEDSSTLVTTGIYRISRNPMYLGMAVCVVAAGLGAGNIVMPLAVAGFIYVINRVQILPEEAGLGRIFGADYEAYCKRVRRWL